MIDAGNTSTRLAASPECLTARQDDPCRRAQAHAGDLVDRLAIQRVVHREAWALVVPRGFRVPLVQDAHGVGK